MDTKYLRNIHRRRYTQVETIVVNNNEVKIRVKSPDYMPFRKWVRKGDGKKLVGKAREIWEIRNK